MLNEMTIEEAHLAVEDVVCIGDLRRSCHTASCCSRRCAFAGGGTWYMYSMISCGAHVRAPSQRWRSASQGRAYGQRYPPAPCCSHHRCSCLTRLHDVHTKRGLSLQHVMAFGPPHASASPAPVYVRSPSSSEGHGPLPPTASAEGATHLLALGFVWVAHRDRQSARPCLVGVPPTWHSDPDHAVTMV